MADDIDDLLNDVETKFCGSGKGNRGRPSSPLSLGSRPSKAPNPRNPTNADIDTLIDDIFDDDFKDNAASKKTTVQKKQFQESAKGHTRKGSTGPSGKCFPVFIGDPQCARGMSSSVNNRACDNLRCTDCDFSVCMFPNYTWHSSVDYLFLRNNIPDFDRLKPKLVTQRGTCAYACQCKWKSVKKTKNLAEESNLKWVCGRH